MMKLFKGTSITIATIALIIFSSAFKVEASTGTWSQRISPDAPNERSHYAMAYDNVRNVTVMFGGLSRASGDLNETWELSGTTWTRIFPAHSPSGRYGHAMAFDEARQQVVLFGGDVASTAGQTWVWDGNDWTLKTPVNNPSPRGNPQLVYDKTRQVVVMYGGVSSNDTWEWDGTDWTEKHPTNNPGVRERATMSFDLSRNKVVLYGGLDADNQTWEYDGNDWTDVSPLVPPTPGSSVSMVYDESIQKSLLFTYDPSFSINRVWAWDGTVWTNVTPVNGPDARDVFIAAYDSTSSRTVFFGGEVGTTPKTQQYKDTWAYNGTANSWSQIVVQKNPPAGPAPIAYDTNRHQIVRFGGSTNTSGGPAATNETWILGDSDTTWTRKFPAHNPPARLQHSLAYDVGRDVVVMFAGRENGTGNSTNNTWEWDGTDWIEKFPTVSPSPRYGVNLEYDSDRHVIVMFGAGPASTSGETWEYDGTTWVQKNPVHHPSWLGGGGMAYDSIRHKMVLFGEAASYSNETWEYDGTDWTLRSLPQSAPGRSANGMAFDVLRGVVVTHGGINPGYAGDTWEYDGNTWTQSASPTNPGSRYTSMVYNSGRQAITIVAGGVPSGLIDDTWEYAGPIPENRLTALAPAKVWVGLKNSDDVGIKFDLKAEVYVGTTLAGTSEIYSVPAGSSGFNNAKLDTIPLVLAGGPYQISSTDPLNFKLYVRNTCFGPTHNNGTARLWYNDNQANSYFGATIDTQANNYYLLNSFVLNTTAGAGPKKTIDISAGAPCSAWKLFGTWTKP